jgi:hypothetical protein
MSKSLLTLGIVVSLASVGCAGVSPRSTVASVHHSAPGIDRLWDRDAHEARAGVAGTVRQDHTHTPRADLWNPASSPAPARPGEKPEGVVYVSDAASGIAF